MNKSFKPMLACNAPPVLNFPIYASAKLDGVRCIMINGVAMSRSLKPIPNKHVQKVLGALWSEIGGMDGELIVGDPTAPDAYRKTSSGVMSIEGQPEFTFYVFDNIGFDPKTPFKTRYSFLESLPAPCELLPHVLLNNVDELRAYEEEALKLGFEGLVLRDPNGIYKYGRSSQKEGILLKLKRYSDAEAEIVGVQELVRNDNPATTDELGYTSHSGHKANLTPMNTLGALLVKDVKTGIHFSIGTGFTAEARKDLWNARNDLIGQIVKYKHFEVGVKEAPRFPVFLGFRSVLDM